MLPLSSTETLPAAAPRRGTRSPLLRRLDRDRESFTFLVGPSLPTLKVLALRLSKRRADADDLLQDTLEHAYVAFDNFELGTNPRPWLATIMRNLFLDHCRRRARARSDGDGSLERMAAPVLEEVARWRTVEVSQIERALTRVDADLKRAFVLRWQEQRSYREIAGQLRIPLNTVGTRLLRVRRMIRAALETDKVSTDALERACIEP